MPPKTPPNSVAIGISGELALSSIGQGVFSTGPSAPTFRILVQVRGAAIGPLQQTVSGSATNYIAQG